MLHIAEVTISFHYLGWHVAFTFSCCSALTIGFDSLQVLHAITIPFQCELPSLPLEWPDRGSLQWREETGREWRKRSMEKVLPVSFKSKTRLVPKYLLLTGGKKKSNFFLSFSFDSNLFFPWIIWSKHQSSSCHRDLTWGGFTSVSFIHKAQHNNVGCT